jgi:hypothetical protein
MPAASAILRRPIVSARRRIASVNCCAAAGLRR